MKRYGILLLVLLLYGSLFACAEAQNAQDAFTRSAESAMIGRTFQEVEASFGPLSEVTLFEEQPAAYIFEKTGIAFHFDAPLAQEVWAARLKEGEDHVPAVVALQDIQPEDRCIGVSGRVRDFGVAESDVAGMSRYIKLLKPKSYETRNNTIYVLTSPNQAYDVFLYCAHGETGFGLDHQVRVMTTGIDMQATPEPEADPQAAEDKTQATPEPATDPQTTPEPETQATPEPKADPQATSFSFGGVTIPVGGTQVEVRGTKAVHRTVTAQEFSDLVLYCPHLQTLILDYCDVSGAEQIGQLTELTALKLMTCGISDISFVRDLKKLTQLGLCHNDLSDVSAIEELPLTYLNLGDNPRLGNTALQSVGKVTDLKTLYLYDLNISSLSALRSLRKLSALNLNNDTRITEKELAKLTNQSGLRSLQINSTGVKNLDFLVDVFPNLRDLEARKLKKLQDPNKTFCQLTLHQRLANMTLSKDVQSSLDANVQANYGMNATAWFKSRGVTLKFK